MDPVSPSSNVSTASSTDTETSKQPKYTTVGSIYKPKAATLLQPPTRRPRTRRYPQALRSPTGEVLAPFPESLLSALAVKSKPSISPPPLASATLPQYSPLQQNYDRAVSPVSEQEKFAVRPSTPMPSIRSGNLPSPASLEGDDSAALEDTLASSRITVKGLTNLASYPNPMQRAAQKALARARIGNHALSRPVTPSLPSLAPELDKDRLANNMYGATAAVTGPPKPLTAGPPGQRLFKPSTFEAASRVLKQEDQAAAVPLTSKLFRLKSPIELSRGNPGSSVPSETDPNDPNGGGDLMVRFPFDVRDHGPVSRTSSNQGDFLPYIGPPPAIVAIEGPGANTRRVYDTLPPERIMKYFPNGLPSNYDGQYTPMPENWCQRYPLKDGRLPQEHPPELMSKLSRQFYAGTEGLLKDMDQIARDRDRRCSENKIGVIGEERLRLRGGHIEKAGVDGKAQPPLLSV